MKKRFLGVLLSLCLALMLIPAMAFAEGPTVTINGVSEGTLEFCKDQKNYEFTITVDPPESVQDLVFVYNVGDSGGPVSIDWDKLEKVKDGVWSGTIPIKSGAIELGGAG